MSIKGRHLLAKYKSVIHNAGYLTVLQVLNLVFPLITYPYLIKALGSDVYGEIILAQGVAFFLCAFVSYGFNLSATREISLNNDKLEVISIIFTSTIIAKFILFLPALILYFIYVFCFKPSELHLIYFLSIGPLIYEVFFPTWLFQGLEKMKYITILNAIFRMLMLISIFLFIKISTDATTLTVINMSYYIFLSITSQIMLRQYLKVKYTRVKLYNIKNSFINGYSIFISSIFIALKDRLNIIIVGEFFGTSQVVVYDIALKIISVLSIPQNILLTAFFPRVVNKKEITLIKKLSLLIFTINVSLVSIMYLLLPYLVGWILPNINMDSLSVVNILLISVVFVGVSSAIGRLVLLPFGYDKFLAKIVFINCGIYFFLMFLFLNFIEDKNIINFSYLILIMYGIEVIIRGYTIKIINISGHKLRT